MINEHQTSESDDVLQDGDVIATSFLPENYSGCVAICYRSSRFGVDDSPRWAIFNNASEGHIAASMASRSDVGGYSNVEVHPGAKAPPGSISYGTAIDWLIES